MQKNQKNSEKFRKNSKNRKNSNLKVAVFTNYYPLNIFQLSGFY